MLELELLGEMEYESNESLLAVHELSPLTHGPILVIIHQNWWDLLASQDIVNRCKRLGTLLDVGQSRVEFFFC